LARGRSSNRRVTLVTRRVLWLLRVVFLCSLKAAPHCTPTYHILLTPFLTPAHTTAAYPHSSSRRTAWHSRPDDAVLAAPQWCVSRRLDSSRQQMNSYDEGFGTRARRFLSEMFGVRGSKNMVSWLLAGGAAYYLFYLPEKQRVLEIQVGCGGLLAASWTAETSVSAPSPESVSMSDASSDSSSDGSIAPQAVVHHLCVSGVRPRAGRAGAGKAASSRVGPGGG
jgi:hypothetical protein